VALSCDKVNWYLCRAQAVPVREEKALWVESESFDPLLFEDNPRWVRKKALNPHSVS